jgi:hypothetical protein
VDSAGCNDRSRGIMKKFFISTIVGLSAIGVCSTLYNPPTGGGGGGTLAGPVTNIQYRAIANGTNFIVTVWFDATNNVFRFTKEEDAE